MSEPSFGPSNILREGGIGILPTDTLYGLVASALQEDAVLRVYETKGRDPQKPLIILIASKEDLTQFHIKLREEEEELLSSVWPGKVSIVLPCEDAKFEYLRRGSGTLSFRLPDKPDLITLLQETGPLVAPSANPEGEKPAETITEAKEYFGDRVDFYEDGGMLQSEPSTLVKIENGEFSVLRQGAVSIPS